MSEEPKTPPQPEHEVLETGQEEVFSRAEVELGRIEHASGAGKHPPQPDPPVKDERS